MAYKTQPIGPWDGGLNLSSSRDLSPFLASNELGIAENVQLTIEGFLAPRPGCRVVDSTINAGATTIKILGTIKIVNEYVAVVQITGGANTLIYYVRGDKSVTLKATMAASISFSSVIAMNNNDSPIGNQIPRGIFLFSSLVANGCYRLEETPALTGTVTPTLMASALVVPRSSESFLVKDRLFLIDKQSSTIYWSAVGTESIFFNTEEVDGNSAKTSRALEAGFEKLEPSVDESDNITTVEFINNSFYLFKKTSTYLFSYQAAPEDDGYLRKINNDLGAFDSTIYRNTVVVINNKGVFSVEGTEFIDLQRKLDLRFETELDRLTSIDAFITDSNNSLLIGYRIGTDDPVYYVLNGYNRGWTQWKYDYHPTDTIASPGSTGYFAQSSVGVGVILYTTFDSTRLLYSDYKPSIDNLEYHMDSNLTTDTAAANSTRYIPAINVQTKASVGSSPLDFKKVYRTYIRFYLSDIPTEYGDNYWTMSINYNDYYFSSTNPEFVLTVAPEGTVVTVLPDVDTVVTKRTYQVPMSQHRTIEFAFQISRNYSKLVDIDLTNPEVTHPIRQGFYFLLSGLWFDYQDRAGI